MTLGFEWTAHHFEEQDLKPLLSQGTSNKGYNPSIPALWAVNYARLDKNAFSEYKRQGGVDFVVIPPRTSFTRERNLEIHLQNFRDRVWYMNFNNDKSCTQLKVIKGLGFDHIREQILRSQGIKIERQPRFIVHEYEIYQGSPANEFVREVEEKIESETNPNLSSPRHLIEYLLV